jgi:hypothetical protein
MFGLRKKWPAFIHADDCKIAKVDPDVKIQWSEVENGRWEAVCVCKTEHYREPAAQPSRLDPLDPSTFRHAPQCEFRDTTDPAIVRALLKVKDGMGGGYWWVECGACNTCWQVPYEAAESVG